MSFTSDIKNEISNSDYSKDEMIAELSAIINISALIENNEIKIYFETLSVARRIYKLIKDLYHIEIDMEKVHMNNFKKKNFICIVIKEKVDFILEDLSINKDSKRLYVPEEYIVDTLEDRYSYLRGVFFACGSINDPKMSRYHAEFMIKNKKTADFVNELLNDLYFNSKVIKRSSNYMVYLKEAERISDFIKLLGAYNALYYFEDIRIYRDHKNMTNRLNNCEQANADKIVETSLKQIEDIKKLRELKDFDMLDDKIQELCIYKEKYPESSMSELADIISLETGKKITKSGINHRFRKIKEIISKNEQDYFN